MEKKILNGKQFVSVCLGLLRKSAEIICEVRSGKDMMKEMKGYNDPVTEADFKAQYIIQNGLLRLWPDLKIVGEESSNKLIEVPFDFDSIQPDPLGDALAVFDKDFEVSELAVYIDPLDGTKSYVDGKLRDVTTLIGLSYKSSPLIGLVNQIWAESLDHSNPVTYVGIMGSHKVLAIKLKDHNKYEILKTYGSFPAHAEGQPWKMAVSINHYHPEVEKLLSYFPSVEKAGISGMGNKYVKMINGEIDGFLQNMGGCGKWDTLAGSTLVQVLGAGDTGTRGEKYCYDGNPKETTIDKGIFALNDSNVHAKLLVKFHEYYDSLAK